MRTQVNTTKRKNKSKQSTKTKWKPHAKKTWGYEMKINDNKRIIIYHKLVSDGGAIAMMCGKYEEPCPSVTTWWIIVMACTHGKAMDTNCL